MIPTPLTPATTATAWLKKWWWVFAGAIGGGIAFALGLASKKSPIILPEDTEKKDIEEEITERSVQAAQQRDTAQAEVKEAYEKNVSEVIAAETKKAAELEDDPEETNVFLKDVGKSAREP